MIPCEQEMYSESLMVKLDIRFPSPGFSCLLDGAIIFIRIELLNNYTMDDPKAITIAFGEGGEIALQKHGVTEI